METLHALCQRTVVTITGLDIHQDATGVIICSCRGGPVQLNSTGVENACRGCLVSPMIGASLYR